VGARLRLAAEARAGLWMTGRVRLKGTDDAVGVAVQASNAKAASARVAELMGVECSAEWDAEPVAPNLADAVTEPAEVWNGEPMRRAVAGGGVAEKAAVMIAAGLVPLSRDHARAVYPRLFGTPTAAKRALEALPSNWTLSSAKTGNAYIKHISRQNPVSPSLVSSYSPPRLWLFRFGTQPAAKPSRALVAEGFEDAAKGALERALGPLTTWRLATSPAPPPTKCPAPDLAAAARLGFFALGDIAVQEHQPKPSIARLTAPITAPGYPDLDPSDGFKADFLTAEARPRPSRRFSCAAVEADSGGHLRRFIWQFPLGHRFNGTYRGPPVWMVDRSVVTGPGILLHGASDRVADQTRARKIALPGRPPSTRAERTAL